MSDLHQISESLMAMCVEQGHRPGRVQFTKYLYLLDYVHYRLHGSKVTDIEWQFYHFGPWAPSVDESMDWLAESHQFSWREFEETTLRKVDELQCSLGLTTKSIISRILAAFKGADVKVLLEYAYSQTEPMRQAKRGEYLDFSSIPITHSMPQFSLQPEIDKNFQIHPNHLKGMAAMALRVAEKKAVIDERRRFRSSDAYGIAINMLDEEFKSPELDTLYDLKISPEVVEDLESHRE